LADRVEDAVCVGGRGGREEGEGACMWEERFKWKAKMESWAQHCCDCNTFAVLRVRFAVVVNLDFAWTRESWRRYVIDCQDTRV